MRRRDVFLLGFFFGSWLMDWWWHKETDEFGSWEWRPRGAER